MPVKKRWRFRKFFVAFSEYINFTYLLERRAWTDAHRTHFSTPQHTHRTHRLAPARVQMCEIYCTFFCTYLLERRAWTALRTPAPRSKWLSSSSMERMRGAAFEGPIKAAKMATHSWLACRTLRLGSTKVGTTVAAIFCKKLAKIVYYHIVISREVLLFLILPKGQLISKCLWEVSSNFSKKRTKTSRPEVSK